MSTTCETCGLIDPCACSGEIGANTSSSTSSTQVTCCDRDRVDNVWVEGADENGEGGICMLDTMTLAQIVGVLKVDERARADLLRVTSNQDLLDLAEDVPTVDPVEDQQKLEKQTNAHNQPESIPFYAIFRGQPPFSQ